MQTLRFHESRQSPLPPPPAEAERLDFELDGLHDVRSLVSLVGTAAGLTGRRTGDLVLASSELAANSVLHGGGGGTAYIWSDEDVLLVEVRDGGVIEEPSRLGRRRPDPSEESGRGLWIANQLCDDVAITSGVEGTRVRVRMALAGAPDS
jgi:anti-sigma regulatory factor (Ser/Thr protein kinase)